MLTDLMFRVRALFHRNKVESGLNDELLFHLERQAEKYTRAGLTPRDAMRRASIELGGLEQVKEGTRDAWGIRLLHSTAQDVIYALRVLRKRPGFAIAVVASLALGIGANTAIFTLMDAVMWRMLPVKNPETLLVAGLQDRGPVRTGFTYPAYQLLRDSNTLADLAGYATAPINVSIDGPPEPSVQGQLVTGSYFGLLGVKPVLGRAIGADDDRVPNGHPVVMLSYGYWTRRFASDPSVLGRTIRLSAMPFTVIGVTPDGFSGVEVGASPDLYMPIMMQPTVMPAFENLLVQPIVSRTWVQTIARTRPGTEPHQAAAAMDANFQSQQKELGVKQSELGVKGRPAPKMVLAPAASLSGLGRRLSQPLFILLAMVGVLLLTACANVANLLLARAAARKPEFSMRLALGASRGRLMRQLLVESIVLATLGGIAGVLLARVATGLLVAYMSPGATPILLDLNPNLRILTFTVVVTVLTGILFGFAPAWRAARMDVTPALRGLRSSASHALRPGRKLAIAQLALTLPLLAAAGLFVRSLQRLNGGGDGELRKSVVIVKVEPKGSDQRGIPGTAERLDRTYQELLRRIREIPDVQLASLSNATPSGSSSSAAVRIATPSGESLTVRELMAYPNYFATLGIPFARGRDFEPAELGESAPTVCIVNEAFVRRVLPGVDPIGKPCMLSRRPRLLINANTQRSEQAYSIVGVVRDSRYANPSGETPPLIYTPFLQGTTT